MMHKIIDNVVDFGNATSLLGNLVYLDRTLPKQVFRRPHGYASFLPYDLMLSHFFWDALGLFASEQNDKVSEDVILYLISPTGPFEIHSGSFRYGVMEISRAATSTEYESAIDHSFTENPLDTINIISSTIAIAPKSGNWIVWGDRGYEVCILSHQGICTEKLGVDWATAEEALSWHVLSEHCRRDSGEFRAEFLKNYK